MKLEPEVIVVGLFTIFTVLLFGYSFTGNETFNTGLILFLKLMVIIIAVYIAVTLLKIPKQKLTDTFKKNKYTKNKYTKILSILTAISIIYSLITNEWIVTSLLVLILPISILCKS